MNLRKRHNENLIHRAAPMKKGLAVLVAGIMASLSLSGSALAAEPTRTWFTWIGTSQGNVEALAAVCHASNEDCGSPSGDIKFTLFKRKDGAWKRVAAHVSSRDEGWIAEMRVPRRGKCKMVAKYLGDGTYDPSKTSLRSSCNDPDWIR